ncbi:MAG: Ig-like domain-containing protein [Candidatus Korobacteraceae bacterium]
MITVQRLTRAGQIAAALVLALMLASCGGGFFPSSDTIISIALSPASAQIMPTGTQQFTATGTFGNNSVRDVTSQVTWISSAPNIATISAAGLATGVALGTANITAKSGSVTSPASVLTVSSKTIKSISVSPQNQSLIAGSQQQYTATASYSDGSFGDVTSSVTWNSSSTAVATISSSGLATAISSGTTTITAALSGVIGTATLTVQ